MSAGSVSILNAPCLHATPAATPARPAATPAVDRLALLDTMRLIAAIGIVWVHAAQSAAGRALWPIGTFGVPFYTFVAVLFMTRSLTRPGGRSLAAYAGSRVSRVYLPFLFWSGVYVALGEVKAFLHDGTFVVPSPIVFYAGGHEHLWFLPFLMAVTLVGAVIVRGVQTLPALRRPLIVVLIAMGIGAAVLPEPAWVERRYWDYDFWRYLLRAMPTVCWALAFALATAMHGTLPRTTRVLAIAGLALTVAALTTEAIAPFKVLRAFAGFGCLMLALLPMAWSGLSSVGRLGRFSYGIYLSHVAFLRLIAIGTDRLHLHPTWVSDLIAFLAAFMGAAVLSVVLSRSRWTRWTLGE